MAGRVVVLGVLIRAHVWRGEGVVSYTACLTRWDYYGKWGRSLSLSLAAVSVAVRPYAGVGWFGWLGWLADH